MIQQAISSSEKMYDFYFQYYKIIISLSHTHKNHLQIWLRVYINQIPLKILFWKITLYKLFYTLLSPAFRNKT